MKISDFKEPKQHPFGMLSGYKHGYEKEGVLMLILLACVTAGDFVPVKTKYDHPTMVEDGLLIDTPEGYILTEKAKGLLYSQYSID